jgi:phage/plasmid primase-like uncharacterized protein
MAIDSGNLIRAARSLRFRYPASPIIIAGDNDIGLTLRTPPLRNVGAEKAEQAAREVCGAVSIPQSETRSVDWNDFHAASGRNETAFALRRHMRCAATLGAI